MKTLLLGANGLLGHNVLKIILERGMDVRILVRDSAFADQYANRCETKVGSFLDVPTLRETLQGCEAVINCTGTTDMSLLTYRDYLAVNKVGVEQLLQTMEEIGVPNLVHVSTANTIGYGTPDHRATEEDEMAFPFTKAFYAQSKLEAEQMLLWEAEENPNLRIVIVNPTFMIGAYDSKPSSGKLLLAGYKRKCMVSPSGGKNFVPVVDAATAVVNALTMGRSGERYLLAGEDMTIAEFYQLQSKLCGYSQKLWVLPNWQMTMLGKIGDLLRALGVQTQLSTRNVRQVMVKEYYSPDKATKELQMPHTSLEKAIKEFFEWWERQGGEKQK